MIRVRFEGEVRELSYEEFVRAIQDGSVRAETPVHSQVLTSGAWKKAGELQFFRSWAPKGSFPEMQEQAERVEPAKPKEPAQVPEQQEPQEPQEQEEQEKPEEPEEWDEPGEPAGPEAPEEPRGAAQDEPAPGARAAPDERVGGDPIPWEMGDGIGLAPRAIWTVALALRQVDEFFRRISRGASVVPALTFGLLIYAISSLVDAAYGALLWASLGESVRDFLASIPGAQGGAEIPGTRDLFSSHAVAILLYPLFAFLWSWIVHFFLRMFGNPVGPMSDTFRIVNYSIAPLVLTVIPICGNLIGWIWAVLLSIRGLVRNQKVEGSAALLSVVIPFVLIAGIYLFMAVRALSGFGAPV